MWIITIDDALETDMTFENIQIDQHNNAVCTGLIRYKTDGTREVEACSMTVKKWILMEEREE
jgi:hypothetical protein